MKRIMLLLAMVCCGTALFAQVQKTDGVGFKKGEVNLSTMTELDLQVQVHNIDVHPIPSAAYGNLKDIRRKQRLEKIEENKNATAVSAVEKKTRGTAMKPMQVKGIQGNPGQGIPLDNDIAVSNDGIVVSCVNSNIRVTNDTLKTILSSKSLTTLVSALGTFTWNSDPRVVYDPATDRFIMTFFSGADSWDSHIFVGFSKTNRPDSAWTFYELNGNSFNDSTWSDYPILAINDDDVYLTYNQVKDNVSWQIGFKQSVIWQIDKMSGINGAATLPYTLWSDLKLDGVNYRNICPAKPQVQPFGNTMNFVSVRNVALTNDSVFLLNINNSQKSGLAQLKSTVLKTNIPYGFPPNVPTKFSQELMTNDGRVLAAIYTHDKIYFGANTFNPAYNNAGVYLGTIDQVSNTPTVTGKILGTAKEEYGYPSMCYMGNYSPNDDKVLFTFSQCYTDSFPGCAMMYKDNNDDYSDIVMLKAGGSFVNSLMDSVERWGDYSGTHRRFNRTGTAYVANSYGLTSALRTWISIVSVPDFPVTIAEQNPENQDAVIYPSPAQEFISCDFYLAQRSKVNIALYSTDGKLIQQLPNDYLKPGRQTIKIDIGPLPKGNYILRGVGNDGVVFSKQFAKE